MSESRDSLEVFNILFKNYSANTALDDLQQQVTYQQLAQRALAKKQEWQHLLSQKLAGQPVILHSPLSCDWFIDFWALVMSNAIIIPKSYDLRSDYQYAHKLPAELAICNPRYQVEAGKISRIKYPLKKNHAPKKKTGALYRKLKKNDTGLIIFTSGSTGNPKATLLSLQRLFLRFKNKTHTSPLCSILLLKEDHIGGINTFLGTLYSGGKLVLPPNRQIKTLIEVIENKQIQILPMTPSFLRLLLTSIPQPAHTLSQVKIITYGAEAMPPSLLSTACQLLPHIKWVQTYGLTETGVLGTKSISAQSLEVCISDPFVQTKIKNQQLWVKSKYAMLGYLNAPFYFDSEGYFCTQDFVIENKENNSLIILGRKSNLISVGGQKINTLSIESVLLQHAQISQVLVQGEKNALLGQVPVAVVQISPEMRPQIENLEKELRELCRENLPQVAQPMRYRFITESLISERLKKTSPVPL